ncbi:DUF6932 family protein [Salinicoccus sp. HZC-1]|uniref:DUF6932 family protein n=1 Tax=Salinicoccus sp. HZC-1 TaxID=3385497 RepID=UPI00398ACBEB
MVFTFDGHGNISGGIIDSDLTTVNYELVKKFHNSTTRSRNYDSLLNFIELMKSKNVQDGISKLWIDGSFCTNKENPNDIDLVLLLKPFNESAKIIQHNSGALRTMFMDKHLDVFIAYDSSIEDTYIEKVAKYFQQNGSKGEPLDNIKDQIIQHIRMEDKQMKYWMGQFGFDRQQRNKAIISIPGGVL